MTLVTYKIIHLVGLALLFAAIGAMTMRSGGSDSKPPKSASMMHGIAMLVILTGGFGMLAKYKIEFPWPGWVFAKVGVWVLLGVLPIAVKKKWLAGFIAMLIGVALAGAGAWLAIAKPF